MSAVPSLAFAVGVYLPLASSTPIFVGGLVRWLVDRRMRAQLKHHALTEEQLAAEGDKSPGVLMASGYIAGGAIAGIFIAFTAGVFERWDTSMVQWARANNPLFAGPYADALSLAPFALLVFWLYWTGRRKQAPAPVR